MDDDAYLRLGDVITLECDKNCFLSMDPISSNVLWQLSPDRKNAPVNIEMCLWKICPRLSYVDQELYLKCKKETISDAELKDIATDAKLEAQRNKNDVDTNKAAVLFGQVVQLQHVQSGQFLHCMNVPSENDADCFQLRLGAGSTTSHLKISSVYKIRTDGGNVMLGDDIVFTSLTISNHSIFKSAQMSPQVSSYGSLYDEANLSRSEDFAKIKVNLFSRVNLYESRTLCTTQGLRFFDSESNSFIEGPCDLRTFVDNPDREAHLRAIDPAVATFPHHPRAVKAAALWTFVTLDRKNCEYVHWNKPYRIKHIPTSKYLTVVSMVDDKGDGDKYILELENEKANPKDQSFLILPVEKPGDYVESSDVMIQLCHETHRGENLYLRKGSRDSVDEHKTSLYLGFEQNNYDAFMIMEATKDVVDVVKRNYTNWRVAQRYSRYFVPDKEPLPIESVRLEYVEERRQKLRSQRRTSSTVVPMQNKSRFLRAGKTVAMSLRFADSVATEKRVEEEDVEEVEEVELDGSADDEENIDELRGFMFEMLKNLLCDVVVGDEDDDMNVFTVDGDCDEVVQNCSRDQFLIEALLTALIAPVLAGYVKEHEDNGRVGLLGPKEPITFNSVHLLGWIVMKHLIKDNEVTENYVVHNIDIDSVIVMELKPIIASKTTTKIESGDGQPMSFAVARMINQIPFRLGAAYALTTLISNNRELLLSFVNDATLRFFRDLINEWGPDKRFIEVFKAVCSCNNFAIPANQRSMLKLMERSPGDEPFEIDCFRNDEVWPVDSSPMLVQALETDEDDKKESGVIGAFRKMSLIPKNEEHTIEYVDEPYLGEGSCTHGFPRLFVDWSSDDSWKRGARSLYYSAETLQIPTAGKGKSISLEDMSFPLKLAEDSDATSSEESFLNAIDLYYKTSGDRKKAQELYVNHKFLSEYFMEQIRLFSEMCLGRCFETRSHFSNQYDFDMLYSGMANTRLPFGYRAAFSNLMRTLLLDQFPQMKNCGNRRIPVAVYVLDNLDHDNDDVDATLPSFSVPAKFQSDSPLMKYRTPKKFELLVAYCNRYLSVRIGAQCSAPLYSNKNRCTLSVLNMVDKLVSFGFYDTLNELKEVVKPMVLMLDGRMMTEEDDESLGYTIDNLSNGVLQPVRTVQTEKRYTVQDSTMDIIDAKHAILSVLSYVKNIRGQYRLTKFLAYFTHLRRSRLLADTVSSSQIAHIISILTDSRLNIETLSGVKYTDTIFVDLLMYEDEEIFEEALTVLVEEHEPTKALLHNCNLVHFLTNEILDAPMLSYDKLKSDIWELQYLFSSVEEWCGIRHQLDKSKFIMCLNILIRLRQFLFQGLVGDNLAFKERSPSKPLKEFLYALNLHFILFETLDWDLGEGAVGSDDFAWVEVDEVPVYNVADLVTRSLVILGDLVCDKSRNAYGSILSVEYISSKNERKALRKYLYGLLFETFQGSEAQVTSTPEEVVFIFASLLNDSKLKPMSLQFFEKQLCTGSFPSDPIHRNQDLIAHAILENIKSLVVNTMDIENTIETYISSLNLICECCRENSETRNLLQFLFPSKTLLDRINGLLNCILSSDFNPEALHVPILLLDAYVDVFNTICIEEVSYLDEFTKTMNFYVALTHRELRDTSRDNIVLVLDSMLKLLNCHVTQIGSDVDALCLDGLHHLCHEILGRSQSSRATMIWSTTKIFAMDILGLSGDNKRRLERLPPSEMGPQRVLNNPMSRKKLAFFKPSINASLFTKTRIKSHVSKGPLESQKNFFLPSLVRVVDRNLKEESDLVINYKTYMEEFLSGEVPDPFFEHVPDSHMKDEVPEYNPIHAGVQFAKAAGSNIRSAASSVRRGSATISKAVTSAVGSGFEMKSMLGGDKEANESRESEAMQDMYLQLELRNFVKRVSHDKRIKGMLISEKEHVLNVLVNSDKYTDPNDEEYIIQLKQAHLHSKYGSSTSREIRTNTISWRDIVLRMIKHVDFKNIVGKTNDSACRHILYLFDLYVHGAEGDEELEDRQNNLNEWGVIKLCYRLIKAGKDSPLFAEALLLLRSILSEGNTACQDALLDYMKSSLSSDSEGHFFRAIYETIHSASTWALNYQRRHSKLSGRDSQNVMTNSQKAEIEVFESALLFAKEFCEGHNRNSQDVLRDQKFNRRTYNIIGAINDLLEALAPRRDIYQKIGMMPYTLLCSSLDALVESIQGPCPENQVLCVQKRGIEVCKQIITSHTLGNVAEGNKYDARLKAIILLSSLLENRHDTYIENLMASKIEKHKFDEFGVVLANELDKAKSILSDKMNFRSPKKIREHEPTLEDDEEDDMENAFDEDGEMKSVRTVYTKFDPSENVETHISGLKQGVTCLYSVMKCLSSTYSTDNKYVNDDANQVDKVFQSMMCEVDIFWNGKVETMIFPLPEEAGDLSETTKKDFMNNCDLSTRETRVKALMDDAERFRNEMEVYNNLAKFKFYGWLLDNYFYFKAVTLVFVALLVLNILFGHISSEHLIEDHRHETTKGFTIVLSAVSAFGYFVLFLYWFIPQRFIAARVHGERLTKLREEIKAGTFVQTWNYDWNTLLLPYATMPFFCLIAIMHYTAYSSVLSMSTSVLVTHYVVLALALYGFWLPLSFRYGIVKPNNFIEEVYCILFDLLTIPAIFEHLACTLLLVFGYNYLYFYAFVLLDVISMSEHMKNAVRAVTRPMSSLCSVFILFILVVLIFAIIGYFVFDESFIINGEEIGVDDGGGISGSDNKFCTSPLGCFFTVAYGGVRAGDIAEIMTDISPDQNAHYYYRMVFDMMFFIILGVLLFDMVTGIIVDTFVSLREETMEREQILNDEVFISGITQEMCTDKGVSFEDHQEKYQNAWNYVYLYVYLEKSDKTELNGAQDYVWTCIQENDLSWFPRLTSSRLQNVSDDDSRDLLDDISSRMARLEASVAELTSKLN